jgi:hypothetical protein
LPAISPAQKIHLFGIAFDKACGEDNECHTDLALSGTLLDMTRTRDGIYQAKVTEKDALIVRIMVENKAERAYMAKMYLNYDETELDEPRLVKMGGGSKGKQRGEAIGGGASGNVDIVERNQNGTAILTLGNPLEAGKKVRLPNSWAMSFLLLYYFSWELTFSSSWFGEHLNESVPHFISMLLSIHPVWRIIPRTINGKPKFN